MQNWRKEGNELMLQRKKNFNLSKIKMCVTKMNILQLIKFSVNLKARLVSVLLDVTPNRGESVYYCFKEEKFGGNKER